MIKPLHKATLISLLIIGSTHTGTSQVMPDNNTKDTTHSTQPVTYLVIKEEKEISSEEEDKTKLQNDNLTMAMVEEAPEFPGGSKALIEWLGQQIVYPTEAAEQGIEGRVTIEFIIERDGSISSVKVARGKHPALDAEAVRVVSNMPRWKPGLNAGRPVRVTHLLPINFILDKPKTITPSTSHAKIDSIAYERMMKLGDQALKENTITHAQAYYHEALAINPLEYAPVEKLILINKGDEKAIYETYNKASSLLFQYMTKNGFDSNTIEKMENHVNSMLAIDPQNHDQQVPLLYAYLSNGSKQYIEKVKALIEPLIIRSEQHGFWDDYAQLTMIKINMLENDEEIILYCKNKTENLTKSPYGSMALKILSEIYGRKGDIINTQKYNKMTNQAKEKH